MVKYKFIYNRKSKLKKDGTALIQLEIYKDRIRKFISTEIAIAPNYWDEKVSKVLNSHSRSEEYNMILHDMIQKVEAILRKAKLQDKDYSVDQILALIRHEESNFLSDFMTKEIEKDLRIKTKTKTDLLNTKNRLVEFNCSARLQDIDYKFVIDFDNYLRSMGYSINTIGKLHKNLKRFLNLAIKYNLISQNDYPYRNFKVEKETTNREALTMQEILDIEKLEYDQNSINDQVKDMFLFACYTGLRISDVTRLKTTFCKKSSSGWRLEFKTFKVQKLAYLPLKNLFMDNHQLSKPERIIDKYYNAHKDLVFPTIPESKINRQLKAVAAQAGIKKTVTFHMGRHTFGTIMSSKIPLASLQSLMQHSDIKTTMIYVNISNDIIDDNLGKVDWNQ